MGNRLDSTMRGLLIPDPRLGVDGLAANDATVNGSDYTQQGGRPGSSSTADPNSRIVPVVSGGLIDGIEVEIVQAGDPGIVADSARLHWREIGEPDLDWRGHADPVYAGAWLPIVFSLESDAESSFDVVVDPVSQRVLVGYRDEQALFRDVQFRRSVGAHYFEDNAGAIVDLSTSVHFPLALTILPSGRVICIYLGASVAAGGVFFSDDAFTAPGLPTWSAYADVTLTESTAAAGFLADRYQMEADRDGNVLLLAVQEAAGAEQGFVIQYVSRNLGANFTELEGLQISGASLSNLSTAVLPDGSIVVGYMFNFAPRIRVLANPFDLLSEAVEIEIDASLVFVAGFGIWSDPRGILFCYVGGPSSMVIYRSEDSGLTWDKYDWGPWNNPGSSDYGPRSAQVVACRGGAWMIHGSPDSTATFRDHSLGCLMLGGWTNLEPGAPRAPLSQLGWNDTSSTIEGRTWIPFDTPDAGPAIWTLTTTGGTADRGFIVVATGEQLRYEAPIGGSPELYFIVGGRTITNASSFLTTSRHAVRLILGTSEIEVRFQMRQTGGLTELLFRVRDIHGAVDLFDLPQDTFLVPRFDFPEDGPLLEMRIGLTGGLLYVHYKPTTENKWREAVAGVALGVGAVATDLVMFGALDTAAGASDQIWRAFHIRDAGAIPLNPTYSDLNNNRQHRGAELGGLPIALDRAGLVDVDEAFVALRGGPAVFAELHTVPTIHDFGIAAALFDSGPSRAEHWRSEDNAGDEILTWAFPEATRVGGSWMLGFLVLDANFPTARIEVDTVGGGAGWTTVATLDLREGFTDLAYERHGDTFRPGTLDAGTVEAGRFLNRAELAGGIARWGDAGSIVSGRIATSSAGGWTDIGVNTIQPFVRVDAATVAGTSTASDGVGPPVNVLTLQAPSGLVVAYLDETYVHGVRIVIPGANTPEGYREAGLIMPCAFSAMGQQWSRGYSLEAAPNVLRDETRHGTIRKQEQGPPAMRASMAWPDGTKLDQMRAGLDVDYLGPAGKPPVVADSDVWGQLWGILDETKSGEIPVVYLAVLPADGVTLTDRTLFSFGTLDGSARFDHALGDEGVNEFGRVSGVQVTEIR